MWYLCGLGSNIEPEKNVALALAELLNRFGTLWLSPVLRTQPSGIETPNLFLNTLVAFTSELDPDQLKSQLNRLEESLGRDRSDPLSAEKDRPMDVDILACSADGRFADQTFSEPYFRALFEGDSDLSARVTIDLHGHSLGKAPATIHRNLGAGDEIIVDQGQQLNHHAVESTFPGQQGL